MTFLLFIESVPIILFVVAAAFLLFGASRLPELARSLGQTRKAFKEGLREAEAEEAAEHAKIAPTSTANQVAAPQITNMSDEELMAEMRRRAETKQAN